MPVGLDLGATAAEETGQRSIGQHPLAPLVERQPYIPLEIPIQADSTRGQYFQLVGNGKISAVGRRREGHLSEDVEEGQRRAAAARTLDDITTRHGHSSPRHEIKS